MSASTRPRPSRRAGSGARAPARPRPARGAPGREEERRPELLDRCRASSSAGAGRRARRRAPRGRGRAARAPAAGRGPARRRAGAAPARPRRSRRGRRRRPAPSAPEAARGGGRGPPRRKSSAASSARPWRARSSARRTMPAAPPARAGSRPGRRPPRSARRRRSPSRRRAPARRRRRYGRRRKCRRPQVAAPCERDHCLGAPEVADAGAGGDAAAQRPRRRGRSANSSPTASGAAFVQAAHALVDRARCDERAAEDGERHDLDPDVVDAPREVEGLLGAAAGRSRGRPRRSRRCPPPAEPKPSAPHGSRPSSSGPPALAASRRHRGVAAEVEVVGCEPRSHARRAAAVARLAVSAVGALTGAERRRLVAQPPGRPASPSHAAGESSAVVASSKRQSLAPLASGERILSGGQRIRCPDRGFHGATLIPIKSSAKRGRRHRR